MDKQPTPFDALLKAHLPKDKTAPPIAPEILQALVDEGIDMSDWREPEFLIAGLCFRMGERAQIVLQNEQLKQFTTKLNQTPGDR